MAIKKLRMSALILLSALLLSACNPQFNWREIHSNDAPFSVLMPGKADSFSQDIQLAGVTVKMTMTATDVGGLNFAVGSLKLADVSKTTEVLAAMQNGMIKNIQGRIIKPVSATNAVLEVQGKAGGSDVVMAARFLNRGNWVYQVIVLGPQNKMTPEIIETFMSSFVAN
ncbi:hypothetical protein H8K32_10100 [Undibacterium jejuense]|uniref:Transmembrane protein n=1 Tax=Undibacterium jejuense TaxID=1344949 RepID=A0A923HG80_9BURK|nr:hypothetical protein [Undibacterium jejuense]MBC3862450.1 hypothetical protein [Undibacterium jejuense]